MASVSHQCSETPDTIATITGVSGGTAHPVERDFVTLEVGRVLGHHASFPINDGTSLRILKCRAVHSRTVPKYELFKAPFVSDLKGRGQRPAADFDAKHTTLRP